MKALVHERYFDTYLPRVGEYFGTDNRFEVLALLGSGGAGEVLLVSDRLLCRKAAAKFMREVEGRSSEQDAHAEARATARLNHENVVTVYDLCAYRGAPCILMEYLQGTSLNFLVGDPCMSPRRAVEILIDVTRGLEHAHAAGILHLDLKPSNVFVQSNGRAKILDFGVGSLRPGEATPSGEYEPGPVVGTPLYMAPEQWGLGGLDARTDIWAAGMVLYELLTGSSPGPESAPSFRLRTHNGPATPRIAAKLVLPSSVDALLARALAPDPDDRFGAAWELSAALERLRISLPDEAGSWVRRKAPIERHG